MRRRVRLALEAKTVDRFRVIGGGEKEGVALPGSAGMEDIHLSLHLPFEVILHGCCHGNQIAGRSL